MGRRYPSEKEANPTLYRMRIFAPEDVSAKSRYWYFMSKLRKLKKANGEIVSITEVWDSRDVFKLAAVLTPHRTFLCLPRKKKGSTEDAHQDQEHRDMAAIRLEERHTQHVPRIPRPHHHRSCDTVLLVRATCLLLTFLNCSPPPLCVCVCVWYKDRDMGAKHRARTSSIHILRVEVIPTDKCRRPQVKQFHVRRPRSGFI